MWGRYTDVPTFINPLGYEGVLGPGEVLTCTDICAFSVAYKHINGQSLITLLISVIWATVNKSECCGKVHLFH